MATSLAVKHLWRWGVGLGLASSLLWACGSSTTGGAPAAPTAAAQGPSDIPQANPTETPSASPSGAESAPVADCRPLQFAIPEPDTSVVKAPVPELQDFGDHQMAPFYESLAAIARGKRKEPLRIGFYGDSNMTRDFITGQLRRELQKLFGDSGHGYIGLAKPWSWYWHMDVEHGFDKNAWKAFNMATIQVADRYYGFGGIAPQNIQSKARTWVATAKEGSPVGTKIDHVEIYYLKKPKHGTFEVLVDKQHYADVDTAGPTVEAGRLVFDLPEGPHRIDIISGPKLVRLLGAILERKAPGVVVDSIGVGGVNSELLARADRGLVMQTLKMRRHELFVLLTGAIEPDSPKHAEAMKEVIARHREARPGVPFILMSPPDLAGGSINVPTKSVRINQVAKAKLKTAKEVKTVYWDFRGAMGGEQSIVNFAQHKMAWTDFIHLTEPGGRLMGKRFAIALLRDFKRYLGEHPEAGCSYEPPPKVDE